MILTASIPLGSGVRTASLVVPERLVLWQAVFVFGRAGYVYAGDDQITGTLLQGARVLGVQSLKEQEVTYGSTGTLVQTTQTNLFNQTFHFRFLEEMEGNTELTLQLSSAGQSSLDIYCHFRNPGHVAPVTQAKPKVATLTIRTSLEPEEIRFLKTHAMSGYDAWQCCTDTIGDLLGAAQIIVENQVWWVGFTDILQALPVNVLSAIFAGVQLSASELYELLGIWSTSGAQGLQASEGPLAAPALIGEGPGGEPSDAWKTKLAAPATIVAFNHVLDRLWSQNSPRVWLRNRHRKRLDDSI